MGVVEDTEVAEDTDAEEAEQAWAFQAPLPKAEEPQFLPVGNRHP